MATAGVQLTGLDDWRALVAALPDDLKTEAAPIVRGAAVATAAQTERDYPRSGRPTKNALKDGVGVRQFGPLAWEAYSAAPHGHLYEQGTVLRTTRRSNASRGRMPATPTIVPHAIRQRALMVSQLVLLLRRAGFTVTESGG